MIKRMRMSQAIAAALAAEMTDDPRVVLIGEDVGAAGGVFKTSDGLLEQFGPLRVRDTPIAEMGFVGAALGAAMAGWRPVAEIMFAEFLGVALDQLVTEAALVRYLSAGEYTAPMVVRTSAGAGLGFGAQHSQTLENWFLNTPGLKIVGVSGPDSAYRLLRAAIRDPDPVLVIEPRVRYGERGDVDLDAEIPALGSARLVPIQADATGEVADVTLIAFCQTVATAIAAAEQLSAARAEVIDLQTLTPLDLDTVLASVGRTGRIATVEANPAAGGWGATVVDAVVRAGWSSLRCAPLRITAPDVPVPYSAALEQRWLPHEAYVSEQLEDLVRANEPPPPWWSDTRSAPAPISQGVPA